MYFGVSLDSNFTYLILETFSSIHSFNWTEIGAINTGITFCFFSRTSTCSELILVFKDISYLFSFENSNSRSSGFSKTPKRGAWRILNELWWNVLQEEQGWSNKLGIIKLGKITNRSLFQELKIQFRLWTTLSLSYLINDDPEKSNK